MSGKKKHKAAVAVLVVLIVAGLLLGLVLLLDIDLTGKGRYPLLYPELIRTYADEYGLDPYFVAAVIHTESGFDPQAVSRAGAVGLMQIMPETGEWIAGKLGVDAFDQDRLFDPETSIRFGCWYLGFLKDKFGGDLPLMMAAYNAGHNRVAQWLEDSDVSDGTRLTNIPFPETEQYVKKVSRAYEKYQEYYPGEL